MTTPTPPTPPEQPVPSTPPPASPQGSSAGATAGSMLRMATAKPARKVAAGGLGGAVSVIVIACLQHFAKLNIDPTLASAITIVISFVLSYLIPPGAGDEPVAAS